MTMFAYGAGADLRLLVNNSTHDDTIRQLYSN